MTSTRSAAALALLIITAASVAQDAPDAAAERARGKIDAIIALVEEPREQRPAPVRTLLNEVEINAYLRVYGSDVLPKAISEPEVRLGDDSRIRARAMIDLDEVRQSRARAWSDPLAYVAGSVEVVASGRMVAEGGIGRAQLESATVAGVSVPETVVQELLRFFTATSDHPAGFDLDRPFVLPADIRRIVIRPAQATIVQ